VAAGAAWTVGRLAATLGDDAVLALGIAGVANTVILLVAFRSFVLELTRNVRAPFYALLAVLLLWGPRAWRWSGVPHLDSIGYVAPYPSMFALAITLVVLVQAARFLRTDEPWRLAVVAAGTWLVVLTHPPTTVVLAGAGLVVALTAVRPIPWVSVLGLAGAGLVGAALTLAWPLYSLLDLRPDRSLSPTESFESSDDVFYQSIPIRLFPALLALPILWRRVRAQRFDTLTWLVGVAAVLWVAGLITGVGRPIVFAVLVMQIAIGDGLGRIEQAFHQGRMTTERWVYAGACAVLAVVGLVVLRAGPARMLPEEIRPSGLASSDELVRIGDRYGPVDEIIGDDDVVLSSETASTYLPAFTGRQVGSKWSNPFASDDAERRRDVGEFFAGSPSPQERQALLDQYGVRWIAIARDDGAWRLQDELIEQGAERVCRSDDVVVLRVQGAG
jgi:hypothetical protein